jgi:hypothetical protein
VFTLAGALFAFGMTRLFAGPAPASSASQRAVPPPLAPAPQAVELVTSQRLEPPVVEESQISASTPATGAVRPPAPSREKSPRAVTAAARSAAAPPASASAAGDSAPAPATLRLTADPPAMVTVEGPGVSRTTATPVAALAVSPGSYRVVFRNETYGPPVATRVELQAGALLRVHADFREAEPRVTVR